MPDKSISAVIIEQSSCLTLDEFCHAIHVEKTTIVEMVEHELVQPEGDTPEQWRFDSTALRRGRIATSFYRDLEINMSGIALALDLLEKIEYLEQQLDILERNN